MRHGHINSDLWTEGYSMVSEKALVESTPRPDIVAPEGRHTILRVAVGNHGKGLCRTVAAAIQPSDERIVVMKNTERLKKAGDELTA